MKFELCVNVSKKEHLTSNSLIKRSGKRRKKARVRISIFILYAYQHIQAPSTLIHFHFKHILFCAFSPIVHTNTMENGYLDPQKRKLFKTPSKVETFENGCLSYQCGRAKTPKTKVFENADVMNSIISLQRRTKTYRFLIASVDG